MHSAGYGRAWWCPSLGLQATVMAGHQHVLRLPSLGHELLPASQRWVHGLNAAVCEKESSPRGKKTVCINSHLAKNGHSFSSCVILLGGKRSSDSRGHWQDLAKEKIKGISDSTIYSSVGEQNLSNVHCKIMKTADEKATF